MELKGREGSTTLDYIKATLKAITNGKGTFETKTTAVAVTIGTCSVAAVGHLIFSRSRESKHARHPSRPVDTFRLAFKHRNTPHAASNPHSSTNDCIDNAS
mmetsp:Transcript_8808/g.17246  ORF Transcript_8808/g.17246 Transcript_8808/m.17246 type:complete len:101 (-) Transcript_8808:41-343(-)